ncbi:L,D-transpeptidase [Longispora sp. NPDC051575]|uniref:L,D-transpeptidase n=1 Tax=Longispora sp. NPDC051575 TaxID=3154943 RepID=UPI003415A938
MTDDTSTPTEFRSRVGLAAVFGLPVIYTLVALFVTSSAASAPVDQASAAAPAPIAGPVQQVQVPVPSVSPDVLAGLVEATTWTTVPQAPLDTDLNGGTDGFVVHPPVPIPVFSSPGGEPIARLPARQGRSLTWLPVIVAQPGWFQVMLPSRPNGATGWIPAALVETARSPYEIRTRLAAMTLDLLKDGQVIGSWTTSPGKSSTPTPTGRSFILAAIRDSEQTYSPVILPLGTHSATLTSFGSGPGTIALHTWPSDSVLGTAASHGCVRIPGTAMAALLQVPAGTVIRITP